jgi:hypothetical protein
VALSASANVSQLEPSHADGSNLQQVNKRFTFRTFQQSLAQLDSHNVAVEVIHAAPSDDVEIAVFPFARQSRLQRRRCGELCAV